MRPFRSGTVLIPLSLWAITSEWYEVRPAFFVSATAKASMSATVAPSTYENGPR